MKRNMELARTILLRLEADEWTPGTQITISGHDEREVAYHVALLGQAGLLSVTTIPALDPFPQAQPLALTNAGHDFIALAANETLWARAKTDIVKPLAIASFDLLLAWLKQEAKKHLGI